MEHIIDTPPTYVIAVWPRYELSDYPSTSDVTTKSNNLLQQLGTLHAVLYRMPCDKSLASLFQLVHAGTREQLLAQASSCWHKGSVAGTREQMLAQGSRCWHRLADAGTREELLAQGSSYKLGEYPKRLLQTLDSVPARRACCQLGRGPPSSKLVSVLARASIIEAATPCVN